MEAVSTPIDSISENLQKVDLSYLDAPESKSLYWNENSEYQVQLYIQGIHCSSCVHLLEKLPQFNPQVLEARVDFGKSTLFVRLKEDASLGKLSQSIQELGYKPTFLTTQKNIQDEFARENRIALKRLAVAGAAAGNIMLFVIPVYSGLTGGWAQAFNWMSFLLFLPVLLYSAIPFYRGAWAALRHRNISVDLPITIALLSSTALSFFNLVQGSEQIYFDSTASFIFLILAARFLLKKTQQSYLAPSHLQSFVHADHYESLVDGAWKKLPVSALQVGMNLRLQRGQILPVDGTLLSQSAIINTSLYNGESLPQNFTLGMSVLSGSQVLSESAEFKVEKNQDQSLLGRLLLELEQGIYKKSNFMSLTDRLSQYLILTVMLLAIGFFIVYSQVDFHEAFNRSLALIVLACPCALAFGTPLTFGLALKKAQKKGILIKESQALEKVSALKKIFFDKTGTLTQGQLTLTFTEPAHLDLEVQKRILALEGHSFHPIAFALRKSWSNVTGLPKVKKVKEIFGLGLQGKIQDVQCEVRTLSDSLHDEDLAIGYYENQQLVAQLYFKDELREEAPHVLEQLRQRGLDFELLTGDHRNRALPIAQACQMTPQQVHASLFPEEKAQRIHEQDNTCMIGDGFNDSLALQAADVGILMKGSASLNQAHADIYFIRSGLTPLLDLIQIAETGKKVLKRNLTLSLVYNIIGAILALLGFIDPLLAAVLMPISSFAIILSTWWGFR